MTVDLELLAKDTTLHIVLNEGAHARPPIMGTKSVISFQFSWVAGSGCIMISFREFASDRKILGYVAFIMIEKDGFTIDMINFPVR